VGETDSKRGSFTSAVYSDPLLHRLPPAAEVDAYFFWASGQDGQLRLQRCCDCGYFIHPPTGRCPVCASDRCRPEVVSGRGAIYTFTVNYQQWVKGQQPYVIAIVELDEQSGLRLTTNVLGCDVDQVTVGMRVAAGFIAGNGVWYPVFAPAWGGDG
jgi:uncharacterized protein